MQGRRRRPRRLLLKVVAVDVGAEEAAAVLVLLTAVDRREPAVEMLSLLESGQNGKSEIPLVAYLHF